MTPNERARLESLASASFGLAYRMKVGRDFLKEHSTLASTHQLPDGSCFVYEAPCSLAYHIRRSHKRAAKAIRNSADEIINTLLKEAALGYITFG